MPEYIWMALSMPENGWIVKNAREYAWKYVNKLFLLYLITLVISQSFEYATGIKYVRVLNMTQYS